MKRSRSHKKRSRSRKHSPVRIKLTKGSLGDYGYHNVQDMLVRERHHALSRALRHEDPLAVFRKLNALYVLNKNYNHKLSKLFNSDKEWVKRQYL